jgi:hypothetical protein
MCPVSLNNFEEKEQMSPLFVQFTVIYICKIQIDVQSLIDVQSSNRRPILKYMAVFHFLKSKSNDVTDVYFKRRHNHKGMFWSNDGERTRPDSRWGVFDDKNAYVFLQLL